MSSLLQKDLDKKDNNIVYFREKQSRMSSGATSTSHDGHRLEGLTLPEGCEKISGNYGPKDYKREIKIEIPTYCELEITLRKNQFNEPSFSRNIGDKSSLDRTYLERSETDLLKMSKKYSVGNSFFLTFSSLFIGASLTIFFVSKLPKLFSGGLLFMSILTYAFVAVTLNSFGGDE